MIVTATEISRHDAISMGMNRYFTGVPCRNGHIAQRYTSGSSCIECARATSKSWAAANPERVRASSKAWRKSNPEKVKSSSKDWRISNKEKATASTRAWQLANPERFKFTSRDWYYKNQNKAAHTRAEWKNSNPEKVLAYERNRRARKVAADGEHAAEDISSILNEQSNKCAEPTCGVDLSDGYHVDHIMPLSKGGSNWPSNLQCLCASCNLRKSAKHPIEWAQENGRLL